MKLGWGEENIRGVEMDMDHDLQSTKNNSQMSPTSMVSPWYDKKYM
jgi:hypothetical protein